MSVLLLVRHGQASLGADDYDRLSDLGHEQGRALGRHWADLGLDIDRVFVGPRRRHRETYAAAAEALGNGRRALPEATPLPELDEHQGPQVLEHHLGRPDKGEAAAYLRRYQQGTRRWIEGSLQTPPGLEPWSQFRQRLDRGLRRIREDVRGRGKTVVAFTSGGPVAAAAGAVLGLDDPQTLELSWRVRNGAVTQLHFSDRGLGLATFNEVPFVDPRLITFI
ncbi:MAG: phosphoglycerate mutase family protein [Acidobacteriota bacterium]